MGSPAMPPVRRRRAAWTGPRSTEVRSMDPDDVLSEFSINRLDGEPVPDDLRLLLPHRDDLAARSGLHLELDDDWGPQLDADRTVASGLNDPIAVADLRARAEVCRLCAFVAGDRAGLSLGYWRGPSRRKVEVSPIVVLDAAGQFHLCASPTLAEAVLERAYGRDDFEDLKGWLRSLGITIPWETPTQLTLPHEKTPPREHYRQLFERYCAVAPPTLRACEKIDSR